MNCAEIKKLFSPYLDGRVSGSEMRALTRHMQQCAACSREYAAMQRTQQLLASAGEPVSFATARSRRERQKSTPIDERTTSTGQIE